MYLAIKLFDVPDSGAGRDESRDAHLDYLKDFEAQTLFAGPLLTEDRVTELASHRLIEFPDQAAAEAHVANEPYVKAGIQTGSVIEHWLPSVPYSFRDCPRERGNIQFLIQAADKPDGGKLRDDLRRDHEAYQASVEDIYITRGPILDRDGGDQIGSLMIIDVPDLAAAKAFWDAEPFNSGGLFKTVEFYGWRFGRVFDRFAADA